MPPRQVYGKKKSHVFSGRAFIASPTRLQPDGAIQDLANEVSRLQLIEALPDKDQPRRPLSEICDNRKKTVSRSDSSKTSTSSKYVKTHSFGKLSKKNGTEGSQQDQIRSSLLLEPVPENISIEAAASINLKTEDFGVKGENFEGEKPTGTKPQLCASVGNIFDTHLDQLVSLTSSTLASFMEFDSSLSAHFHITKIAEASFSQVFLLSVPDNDKAVPTSRRHAPKPSVLKLIPLTPPSSLIPARQSKAYANLLSLCSTPTNVASEVRLLQHLSPVPGFTNFRGLHLLRGRPGPAFCSGYKTWDTAQRREGKERSHFPDPNRKNAYGADQLWAVIEMQDAGSDLERLVETPAWAAFGISAVWDVFWQVVLACGKAETASRWEHRDLHMGNICVRLPQNSTGDGGKGLQSRHDDTKTRKVGFTGLEATVIDYTISRAEIHAPSGAVEVAFIDLDEDPALFEGDGDVEYQYDIYRFMRAAVFLDDPLADANTRQDEIDASGRTWRGYHPQSNVVWLHFILHQMLENFDHRAATIGNSEEQTRAETPVPVDLNCETILRELAALLCLDGWRASGLRSAGDLVALALKRTWLNVDDVVGLIGDSVPKRRKLREAARTKYKSVSK